ncbi:hypothetical protein LguiA_004475 [Lonicera macranthoides]
MASKVSVVPQNQQMGEEGKKKNGQAEGRNRRVLGDIGNLVTLPAVEGKPINRPITRGFCAQLLAKAEAAAADKNTKKPLGEVVNGGVVVATKRVAVAKVKAVGGPKKEAETVVIISPDDEETKKAAAVTGGKSRIGSSKKKRNKALTSTLTARSMAACGIANKPKDPIANIDESDVDDELAVVEYVEDIYKFYTEDESRIHDYMGSQPDLNPKMRSILIDWLIEVHRKFELTPETLYLTINIVDRYLSVKTVPRKELQLVGISSMLLASKYEEIWAIEVNEFIAISDNAYVRKQVLLMEKAILGKLGWYLTVPTPYVFLVRFIKASVPSDDDKMENMVFFLAELGMMNYSTITLYCPSMIAASAVYAARCTLHKSPIWTETLKHHTGYSEDQLRDCAKLLVSYHAGAAESKLRAVYRKFADPDRGSTSLYPAPTLLPASSSS